MATPTTEEAPRWLVLLPPVPVLFAALLLEHFSRTPALAEFEVIAAANPQPRHLAGVLVYTASLCGHLLVCISAIWYYADRVRGVSKAQRPGLAVTGAGVFVVFMTALICAYFLGLAVATLTFDNTVALLTWAWADAPLLEGRRMALALLLPTTPGVLAVVAAAMAAAIAARGLPSAAGESEMAWKIAFTDRVALMQRDFYILSLVLVSSTVTASLYLHLPIDLLAKDGGRSEAAAYADGVTLFWGTIFTLTLLASFLPAFLVLRGRARKFAIDRWPEGEDFGKRRAWVSGLLSSTSLPRTLINVGTMLAPLIAGPFSNGLQALVVGA